MSKRKHSVRRSPESSATLPSEETKPSSRRQTRLRRRLQQLTPSPAAEQRLSTGDVVRKEQGTCWVDTAGITVRCTISSLLRKDLQAPEADPTSIPRYRAAVQAIQSVDPVAIGDRVRISLSAPETGVVVEVLPRRTKLSRRAAGKKPLEQVVVANVDLMLPLLSAAEPRPKWGLLDRYLVDAELAGLPAVICITKTDLAPAAELAPIVALYQGIGYRVLSTSARDGRGLELVRQALAGKLAVLMGKSGVGKSSLLNALDPGLALKTQAVGKRSGKGRHTTTHLQMHRLSDGARVVDTPGMREFGFWKLPQLDIATLFPEFRRFLGSCSFRECSHHPEPGCAVRQAVLDGLIAASRYESFLRISGLRTPGEQPQPELDPALLDCLARLPLLEPGDSAEDDDDAYCRDS